jgi:hypothetical protein
MPLPITNEIEALESQIARLKEAFENLKGISESDRDIVRNTLRQIREKTEQLKNLKKLRWKTRLRVGLRGGAYAALAYLLIAAVADRYVEVPRVSGGKGPCDNLAKRRIVKVENSSYGPNASYRDAYQEAVDSCNAQKMGGVKISCVDQTCSECKYEMIIKNIDIKTRIFWYTTEIEAYCQCWCME